MSDNTPDTAPAGAAEKIISHSYNEFVLDLPEHWKGVPANEPDTLSFRSDLEQAVITVSAEFYVIPADKMEAIAAHCADSRLKNLHEMRGEVNVLSRIIKPVATGEGLEVVFGAEVPGERIFLYVGYVTSHKVFNFTLACLPERNAAAALFDKVIPGLQVKMP